MKNVTHAQSCLILWDPMDCSLPGSSVHGDSPGKKTGVGFHALLQGIFPIQGSNPGLLHCRILYHLSQPGALEWAVNHHSMGSFWSRHWTPFPALAGRFSTTEPPSFPDGAVRKNTDLKFFNKKILSDLQRPDRIGVIFA